MKCRTLSDLFHHLNLACISFFSQLYFLPYFVHYCTTMDFYDTPKS
jgi:hypothetical protein